MGAAAFSIPYMVLGLDHFRISASRLRRGAHVRRLGGARRNMGMSFVWGRGNPPKMVIVLLISLSNDSNRGYPQKTKHTHTHIVWCFLGQWIPPSVSLGFLRGLCFPQEQFLHREPTLQTRTHESSVEERHHTEGQRVARKTETHQPLGCFLLPC